MFADETSRRKFPFTILNFKELFNQLSSPKSINVLI